MRESGGKWTRRRLYRYRIIGVFEDRQKGVVIANVAGYLPVRKFFSLFHKCPQGG